MSFLLNSPNAAVLAALWVRGRVWAEILLLTPVLKAVIPNLQVSGYQYD